MRFASPIKNNSKRVRIVSYGESQRQHLVELATYELMGSTQLATGSQYQFTTL